MLLSYKVLRKRSNRRRNIIRTSGSGRLLETTTNMCNYCMCKDIELNNDNNQQVMYKYCQILPNIAKYCQILPNITKYCQNIAKYSNIIQHCMRVLYTLVLHNTQYNTDDSNHSYIYILYMGVNKSC